MSNAERAEQILRWLKTEYPDARCALNYATPLELLIATILSAQCTDERVNFVTASLFRKYRCAEDFLAATPDELQLDLASINFYRNKTKSIRGACEQILHQFAGSVPQTIEELTTLPGVARKTANVVLGNAYGIASGIVVDTHVARVSQRLDLTRENAPEKIEKDLIKLIPQDNWILFSHLLIAHGRAVCQARKPRCAECGLETLCPSSLLKEKPSANTQ